MLLDNKEFFQLTFVNWIIKKVFGYPVYIYLILILLLSLIGFMTQFCTRVTEKVEKPDEDKKEEKIAIS